MEYKDIVLDLADFLKNEELKSFFEINDYNIIVDNKGVNLISLNKRRERMSVYKDKNNMNRVHFKGETLYFTLNRDKNDKIYLDHLLIGNMNNMKEKDFSFSFRDNIDDDGKRKIIVKFIDDKEAFHSYIIEDDFINIERITIKDKRYNWDLTPIEAPNYNHNQFYIFKNDRDEAVLSIESKEYANGCLKEFLTLEKTFIGITSYIERRIPFFSNCINEASYRDVRLYEIKKGINRSVNNSDVLDTENHMTKIYQFRKKKKTQ